MGRNVAFVSWCMTSQASTTPACFGPQFPLTTWGPCAAATLDRAALTTVSGNTRPHHISLRAAKLLGGCLRNAHITVRRYFQLTRTHACVSLLSTRTHASCVSLFSTGTPHMSVRLNFNVQAEGARSTRGRARLPTVSVAAAVTSFPLASPTVPRCSSSSRSCTARCRSSTTKARTSLCGYEARGCGWLLGGFL